MIGRMYTIMYTVHDALSHLAADSTEHACLAVNSTAVRLVVSMKNIDLLTGTSEGSSGSIRTHLQWSPSAVVVRVHCPPIITWRTSVVRTYTNAMAAKKTTVTTSVPVRRRVRPFGETYIVRRNRRKSWIENLSNSKTTSNDNWGTRARARGEIKRIKRI